MDPPHVLTKGPRDPEPSGPLVGTPMKESQDVRVRCFLEIFQDFQEWWVRARLSAR